MVTNTTDIQVMNSGGDTSSECPVLPTAFREKLESQSHMPRESGANTEVVRVSDLDSLQEHRDAWNALAFGDSCAPNPYSTYPWIASYLEHRLGPDQRFVCFLAYRNQRLEGVLPVVFRSNDPFGFGRKILKAPTDRHTVSVDCLSRPETAEATLTAVFEAVEQTFPRFWRLDFKRIDQRSILRKLIETDGLRFERLEEPDGFGSYLETRGRFDDYRSELSKNFRGNLRKAANKLHKLNDVRFTLLQSDAIQDAHISDVIAVESSGWKGRSDTAIASSESSERFYRAAMSRLREAGALRMQFLCGDRQVLGGQFGVQIGATLFLSKIGYNEDYSQCAPGNLLFERTVQHAFEDPAIHRLDCLTDMPWHRNWELSQRPYFNIRYYRRALAPLALRYVPDRLTLHAKKSAYLRSLVRAVRSRRPSARDDARERNSARSHLPGLADAEPLPTHRS